MDFKAIALVFRHLPRSSSLLQSGERGVGMEVELKKFK